jgi:hypothetical protein
MAGGDDVFAEPGPDGFSGGLERAGEGPLERADRNFGELLQELRVAQTGVQILFAFLLSLSFTDRFAHVDGFQRTVFVGTLLASALTAALLIAPVAAHRHQFRRGRKPELVLLAHRCVIGGLVTLLVTITGALLLVLDVAVGTAFAATASGLVALCFVALWFVVPMTVGRHPDGSGG